MSGKIQTDRVVVDPIIPDEASVDDELSDVDIEEDDGSSSLSEFEDRDPEQENEDDAEASDELSNPSEDEDSEAETERLEESPQKLRAQKNVVLNSHNGNDSYGRSPSKLHNQTIMADNEDTADKMDEDEADHLSDEDVSIPNDSPKSFLNDDIEMDHDPAVAATSLEHSLGEEKIKISTSETDSKKRKRSIMGSGGLDDFDEPLSKRMGAVINHGDDYAIDDELPVEEGASNPISSNISGEEGVGKQEALVDATEAILPDDEITEVADIPASPKKRGRKKKLVVENGINIEDESDSVQNGTLTNGEDNARNGEEDHAENEGDDEAEAVPKTEEELEEKMSAFDQLGGIEKNFSVFRDRLYDERLAQMNREEAMLRQDQPTHPEFLAMMSCIEARRHERIRVAENLREYELQTLKTYAVARRSQILVQYRQEAREIREAKMEQLGKQWYEIQHDRRNYSTGVPEYTLNYPTRRSQQVQNQVAYSNEVSILSGIAKHVGFPAAPPMAQATFSEVEEDFEKMGRTKHVHQPAALSLQELATLRTVGSTSRFRPAEEQFIEQTPWANPQHPSHAHLLQRQSSAQHTPRTTSPLSQVQVQPRRHSHQQGGPISGNFSNIPTSILQHTNGYVMSGGKVTPHNPFSNASHSHMIVPSPLGNWQPSLSPKQTRPPYSPLHTSNDQQNDQAPLASNQIHHMSRAGLQDVVQEMARESSPAEIVTKRESTGPF
ncbi:hypothetical protein DSL72_005549 [Monilinia vaccinii-corymbosi]|uniref:Transcriptional regulatory protein DEP1 n=1 Tax=Monilinia vaccinii-corymbosi TaxID=61207 RepID=A0A8A3PFY2_9HELO|nr:hypothetical protein DSL72_005549 [Monilinia vaccinii-corymbosi]